MVSDVENVDIMLGSYSREGEDNIASENEANLDSGSSRPQQSSNTLGEDFRSLLNANSRENSEVTIETTRLINEEISNQMSRKLNEIKDSLNIQIQDAISIAITEQILFPFKTRCKLKGRQNIHRPCRCSARLCTFLVVSRHNTGLCDDSDISGMGGCLSFCVFLYVFQTDFGCLLSRPFFVQYLQIFVNF